VTVASIRGVGRYLGVFRWTHGVREGRRSERVCRHDPNWCGFSNPV